MSHVSATTSAGDSGRLPDMSWTRCCIPTRYTTALTHVNYLPSLQFVSEQRGSVTCLGFEVGTSYFTGSLRLCPQVLAYVTLILRRGMLGCLCREASTYMCEWKDSIDAGHYHLSHHRTESSGIIVGRASPVALRTTGMQ